MFGANHEAGASWAEAEELRRADLPGSWQWLAAPVTSPRWVEHFGRSGAWGAPTTPLLARPPLLGISGG